MAKKAKKKLKRLKNIAKNPNLSVMNDDNGICVTIDDLDNEEVSENKNNKIKDANDINNINDLMDDESKESANIDADTFDFEDEEENEENKEVVNTKKEIKNVKNKEQELEKYKHKDQVNNNDNSTTEHKVEKQEEVNKEVKLEHKEETKETKIRKNFKLPKPIKIFVIFIVIAAFIYGAIKVLSNIDDRESFHVVSLKEFKTVSEKTEALHKAYATIREAVDNNDVIDPSNLTLNKLYSIVSDPDEKTIGGTNRLVPIPVLSDENKEQEVKIETTAYQVFSKLENRYKTLVTAFQNLSWMNPVQIVRQYHYDGYSIIGKYNPSAPGHQKGKRHTYFIQNFTNVNMNFVDGDGNKLTDDNNIKDIMSMASVYSYYKNPYDYNNYIRHCYDLFDNSYSFVASISEVYYCSGCMYYDDITNEDSAVPNTVTLDRVSLTHTEQKVPPKQIPHKAGTLQRMEEGTAVAVPGTYEEYVQGIFEGKTSEIYNYCPGHVDLDLTITLLTLDASRGLTSIDSNFGNKGLNFTKDWHGWDALMKKRARVLANKDWDKEYGIDTRWKDYIKPLTREEINYYMNRLPQNTSMNRRILIETALKSVGKIPYYYGGKTSRFGYDSNEFGSKVKPDYSGRSLKGLDCSGWINWVYMTAFNKYMIKTDGTAKLAGEGQKITRKELLPGDLIVRPGIDSHVMMFLEWAEGNKVKVIHENGSINNVSIATFDAYYPHYRRILNS